MHFSPHLWRLPLKLGAQNDGFRHLNLFVRAKQIKGTWALGIARNFRLSLHEQSGLFCFFFHWCEGLALVLLSFCFEEKRWPSVHLLTVAEIFLFMKIRYTSTKQCRKHRSLRWFSHERGYRTSAAKHCLNSK